MNVVSSCQNEVRSNQYELAGSFVIVHDLSMMVWVLLLLQLMIITNTKLSEEFLGQLLDRVGRLLRFSLAQQSLFPNPHLLMNIRIRLIVFRGQTLVMTRTHR